MGGGGGEEGGGERSEKRERGAGRGEKEGGRGGGGGGGAGGGWARPTRPDNHRPLLSAGMAGTHIIPRPSRTNRSSEVCRLLLTIGRQDGRRLSGTFSSARGSERAIAVFSRSGAILLADDDGHTYGTMLAPNRMELSHLHVAPTVRIASCVELTKQP